MKPVRVAVVQDAAVAFNVVASIARVGELLAQAATSGTDLVLFPEAFVAGFPSGLDWGGPGTAVRGDDGQFDYLRYHAGAITVPGPDCEMLGALAARHDVNLIIGVIERRGTTLCCTVLQFRRDGILAGVRRKIMPTMAERTIWGQSDGSSLHAVDLDIGRLGTVICWENYMPLLRQAIYAQGIDFYCAPTADDLESWGASMRHIALEGRCFVLSACQFSRRADFPPDYGWFPSNDPDFIVSRGGSMIVDPFGTVLAGPVVDAATILRAELDRDLVTRGRHSFDAAGHYSRPDIFNLTVDRTSRASVDFLDAIGLQQLSRCP
jgi:predicted amidohydrolase